MTAHYTFRALRLSKFRLHLLEKYGPGHLTEIDMDRLQARFRRDLRRKMLRTVAMTAGHFREADRLIKLHAVHARLCTLDAIQLSVALSLQKRGFVQIFVWADKVPCKVAESVGFDVLNPETRQ